MQCADHHLIAHAVGDYMQAVPRPREQVGEKLFKMHRAPFRIFSVGEIGK